MDVIYLDRLFGLNLLLDYVRTLFNNLPYIIG